jgi:predicted lipoprotein with Yx(FWY)xxD motif
MKEYRVINLAGALTTVNGVVTNVISEIPVTLSGYYVTQNISNHDILIDDGGLVVFTVSKDAKSGDSADWYGVRTPGPLSVEASPTATGRFTIIIEPITLRIDK